jgi:hypothetical protein
MRRRRLHDLFIQLLLGRLSRIGSIDHGFFETFFA